MEKYPIQGKKNLPIETQFNRNGGLTLVPMPGFEDIAERVKNLITQKSNITEVDITVPVFGERASGEPFVKLRKDHIGGHDCVVLTSGPGTYQMLGQLQFVLGYLVGRRAGRICLISAYYPLARSDKDEGVDELALVSHTTHLIEASAYGRLDRIIAVDLHAPQETAIGSFMGLITEVSLARRLLQRVINDSRVTFPDRQICMLFPDEGAIKRFEKALNEAKNRLGITDLPVVYGQKRRSDSRTALSAGLFGQIEALNGAQVICFDDEIATGSTNSQTARIVRTEYSIAGYWTAAVHGVLCDKAASILSAPDCPIDKIYITDTIPPYARKELQPLLESEKLTVESWLSDLANIIYYHHWDISIRELR